MESIEHLNECNVIAFDKTGTLTEGQLAVQEWLPREPNREEKQILFSLETRSEHPVAQAILRWVGKQEEIEVEDFFEAIGSGVGGTVDGRKVEIRKTQLDSRDHWVGLLVDGVLTIKGKLVDQAKSEAKRVIEFLQSKGKSLFIISGDRSEIVNQFAKEVGLSEGSILSAVSPQEKRDWVRDQQKNGNRGPFCRRRSQ